jgi:hypothetical protein
MMWVPIILWLSGRTVLLACSRSAWATGAAMVAFALGETQSFYVTLLLFPVWLIFLFLWRMSDSRRAVREELRSLAKRIPPLAAGLALAVAFLLYRNAPIRDSVMKSGRAMAEVAIFSPDPRGFLSLADTGQGNDLYVSWLTPLLLVVIGLSALRRIWRGGQQERWRGVALLVLVAPCIGVALLATGTQGLMEGRLFEIARKLIPKFNSLRQPMKLMCLAIGLLPVVVAIVLNMVLHRRAALAAGLCATTFAYLVSGKIRPTLCVLDRENAAYAAIARSCDERKEDRRVLAIPPLAGRHGVVLPL